LLLKLLLVLTHHHLSKIKASGSYSQVFKLTSDTDSTSDGEADA
jgi:hypothetical protein